MKKAFLILVILSLSAPAFAAPRNVTRADNYIAVFDLEASGKVDKDILRPLTESIRRELVFSGKWEVIDRGNMNKILGEQKFQMSGCVAGACTVEAGQLLGVGKIVTGTIGLVGKTYMLSLSVINVESGKIEGQAEDKCKCEVDELIDSSKRLVKRLLGEVVPDYTAMADSPPVAPAPEGMVFVKGGCFQMGDTFGDGGSDEKPVHDVCVNDFYMGKYEVTQKQWAEIMGSNPSYFKDCDDCPVESVSYNDIQDYLSRLSARTGKNYRLPTEAEWEYAARSGGKKEKYSGGDDVDSVAWYDGNSGGKTHPVGQKRPNGLGIYDMSGNEWEWVADWYDKNYYRNSPKDNPKGPSSGSYRVLRGGSWGEGPLDVRASGRIRLVPSARGDSLGFRLVLPK